MKKTNAMRILDQNHIEYKVNEYSKDYIDGISVANYLNEDQNQVFKTLVTQYEINKYAVFILPVSKTLDTKKAAKAINQKSVTMIKQKELLPITGYIHGGCSPIGMKKSYITTIDISSKNYEKIYVSGGEIGKQIEIGVNDLVNITNASFFDIVSSNDN